MKDMVDLIKLSILLILFSVCEGVKTYRNVLDVSTPAPMVGGLSLVEAATNVTVQDLTICIRFNLKILGTYNVKARLITITDWQKDENDFPQMDLFWFEAWYPQTFFAFGNPQVKGSYGAWLLQDPITGHYNIWRPNKWTHVCFSYEKKTSFIRMVKDGVTLNLNNTDANVAEVVFPSDFLTKVHLGRCAYDYKGLCSSPGAQFADFNIWNMAMSERQMQDWTTCESRTSGNLVSWTTAKWDLENMVEESITVSEMCKPLRPGHTLFPERRNMTSGMDLCRKMKANVSVVNSQSTLNELATIYRKALGLNEGIRSSFWNGWWDEPHEGTFTNVNNGDILSKDQFQPWWAGEPNGGRIENCGVIWLDNEAFNDMPCGYRSKIFCSFESAPYLQIRGLCYGTKFDTQFSWTGQISNSHHSFEGFTNSKLARNNEIGAWEITLLSDESVKAIVKSEDYPFGTLKWTIMNDPCYEGNSTDTFLNFNACHENEFNCADGGCVKIDQRCDGRIDCIDKSDEINCEMIEIDESYLKEIPAPPQIFQKLTLVNVSVDVLGILEIDEVDSFIAIQFQLHLSWFDPRLVLKNLKQESHLNTISTLDKNKIWMPRVVYSNTEKKDESSTDDKAFVTIARKGQFESSKSESLYNTHIFRGNQNPMTISRVYSIKFICEFDMSKYPFDTQTCQIQMEMRGNSGSFAALISKELKYLGPIDLTQYFVKQWGMKMTTNETLTIEIDLGRRLLNEILTTYLPTILICLVSFSTNYFKAFFFEAIVTVNLTSLLVLTTLFISVSNSLPKTAYIKMIDIWLIFVLCIPFIEVITHTVIDSLREEKEDREINHHGTTVKANQVSASSVIEVQPAYKPDQGRSKPKSASVPSKELVARDEKVEVNARRNFYATNLGTRNQKVLQACTNFLKIGLPTIFAIFTVAYFIVGVSYQ